MCARTSFPRPRVRAAHLEAPHSESCRLRTVGARAGGLRRRLRKLLSERSANELSVSGSQLPEQHRPVDLGALPGLSLARWSGGELPVRDLSRSVYRAQPNPGSSVRLQHASLGPAAAVDAGTDPAPHLARLRRAQQLKARLDLFEIARCVQATGRCIHRTDASLGPQQE